jgi:hypothetical protein
MMDGIDGLLSDDEGDLVRTPYTVPLSLSLRCVLVAPTDLTCHTRHVAEVFYCKAKPRRPLM